MIASKHVTKLIIVIVAMAVALCLLAIVYADKLAELSGGTGVTMQYESVLFDTSEIIQVNIIMDEDKWKEMLDNATAEVYYNCDVVVNGTTFYSVGIRPKGNTSLTSIASNPNSDRYSLKLEFDQYIDGQTCFGLDKLVLNNNYADATNMKEAIVYDMFQYLDTDASLYNYAEISVNGEYWGVYLALEAIEDSFLVRRYGVQSGELYKPDSMDMNGGRGGKGNFDFGGQMPAADGNFSMPDGQDFTLPEGFTAQSPDANSEIDSQSGTAPSLQIPDGEMPDMNNFGGMGGFSMGGGGANLNYTDDSLDSYSAIWDSSVTKTNDNDHKKVVTALKNISEGTELEKYLDVDNILRYMAAHTFAVNLDSLSGSMAHNYYIYEYNGQLNILPWDYNLSFGGMNMGGGGDASSMINDAIDTPFASTKFFDTLLENEEYLERYHEYMNQLVEEYVFGGAFDETYSRIRSQIDSLVETDPNALYTYEEYSAGAEILYATVRLRAESIRGQLDGTVPSTDAGQKENPSALIDALSIDISVMGVFGSGRCNI